MKGVQTWAGCGEGAVSNEGFLGFGDSDVLKVVWGKHQTFEDALKVLENTVGKKEWRATHRNPKGYIKMAGVIEYLWEPKPWDYHEVIDRAVSLFSKVYANPTAPIPSNFTLPGQWILEGGKFIQDSDYTGKDMAAIGERDVEKVVSGIKALIRLHLDIDQDPDLTVEHKMVDFINGWGKLLTRSYDFNKK